MSNSTPTLQTKHSLPPSPPSSTRSGSAVPKELTTASTVLPPVPRAEELPSKKAPSESSQSLKRSTKPTIELSKSLMEFLLRVKQSADDTETIVQSVFNQQATSSAAAEQPSVTEHPIIPELTKLIQSSGLSDAGDPINERVLLTQIINKAKADDTSFVSGEVVSEATDKIASAAAG